MKIGFIRYSPRFGLVAQRDALKAAGVRAVGISSPAFAGECHVRATRAKARRKLDRLAT